MTQSGKERDVKERDGNNWEKERYHERERERGMDRQTDRQRRG